MTVIDGRADRGRSRQAPPGRGPCTSFTWRYVVSLDGSFCRIGNLDGSLDNDPDDELARLHPERVEDEQPARPCSRCGTELLLHWHAPLMTGV
ncbi:hypothetical protein [Streptomyces sp. NPDC046939]|uniref:hypothetical protein n=1 Tax=Streptomyces sp. NPDC046939 TaxID=3155376 RepID=UPI0033D1EE32